MFFIPANDRDALFIQIGRETFWKGFIGINDATKNGALYKGGRGLRANLVGNKEL